MQKRLIQWHGTEFVELSAEAPAAGDVGQEAATLFQLFAQELKTHGLSLDHTVRSRLWGRDRQSRDIGSNVRVKTLTGKARSASSSYICPRHFATPAEVALDLIAMRPNDAKAEKRVVEYDPPIVPIRFLTYESFVVLSGVTTVLPTLEEQFDNIIPRITASLNDGGSSWEKVAKVSFYLHRSVTSEQLNEVFNRRINATMPQREIVWVDGYSAQGKLCEVEVTAILKPN